MLWVDRLRASALVFRLVTLRIIPRDNMTSKKILGIAMMMAF